MNDKTQNVPISVINQRTLESLERGDTEKVAQASTDYTRTQLREDSFAFKILTPEKVTDGMLDRDLDERLRIIVELEPDSPGAKWVPFQTVPEGEYIYGPRYQIPFARVQTKKYSKDIDELRTYRMDIRKVLTDNAIKDALKKIDGQFIATMDGIVTDTAGGVTNAAHNFTGKVQWITLSGGLTRRNFIEAKKMLPRGRSSDGKYALRNHMCLMNDVTAQNLQLITADEAGYATVEEMFHNGLTVDKFWGVKTIFTIKNDLVPDNRAYFFAAPEFLGRAYYLTDWTMYMKREATFIEMFAYWLGGFGIGNVAGVCRVDFGS